MYSLSLRLEDKATPWLRRLAAEIHQDRIKPVVGRAGVNTIRKHLFALDRKRPNRLGGRRTHFYAGAARATQYSVISDGVIISINHVGIAQRYFGGKIFPVKAKRLAIPADAKAYGKRPREFTDLEPVFGRSGVYALAKPIKGKRTAKRRQESIYFFLVKSVVQKPDPTVLPEEKEIEDICRKRVEEHLNKRK